MHFAPRAGDGLGRRNAVVGDDEDLRCESLAGKYGGHEKQNQT
jgi:hypothetical protein